MSWLPNPETIMSGLMKSMGVSVEDFAGFIGTVMTEMRELRSDRLAFRPASIKAYQELTARMERMETKLDRVVVLPGVPGVDDIVAVIAIHGISDASA